MPNYDFKSLSSLDFEILSRDLLQQIWKVPLESFKSGRDSGIDLRYSKPHGQPIIIQCKHYANSTLHSLLSTLKVEVEKIKKINPSRYILITSLGLTPKNKDEIIDILKPYVLSTADVIGRDDLNNFLGLHSEVEKKHYKLWLTSVSVLEKVLHSELYAKEVIEKQHIQKRMKLYVQNDVFKQALEILEKFNHCIVSGIPGIGKTTLAEILLIHYIDRGYQIIKVSEGLNEALKLYKPEIPQVFYYDDFLGQTYLGDNLKKNEDSELVKFLNFLKESSGHKFILTTREHILNQARSKYQAFNTHHSDLKKCIIDLANYTLKDRAKILYNHLYFSSLGPEYFEQVLKEKNYLKIIRHQNFSPRIIEWMTTFALKFEISPQNYMSEFSGTLENPYRLWSFAFERQISKAAQCLLLILATFRYSTNLDDVEKGFEKYYANQAKTFGWERNPLDFKNALREIEGTFISIHIDQSVHVIKFHSPSVNDFLEKYLFDNRDKLFDIIDSFVFPDQMNRLEGILVKNNLKKTSVFAVAKRSPGSFINLCFQQSSRSGFYNINSSFESNVLFLIESALKLNAGFESFFSDVANILMQRIEENRADKAGLFEIFDFLNDNYPNIVSKDSKLRNFALNYFYDSLEEYSDFELFSKFHSVFPDSYDDSDLEIASKHFLKIIDSEVSHWIKETSNPEELRDLNRGLQDLGNSLGLDLVYEEEKLIDAAEKLEREGYYEDDYEPSGSSSTSIVKDDFDEIDNIFSSLKE